MSDTTAQALPNLRLRRTWRWEPVANREGRMGGPLLPLQLVGEDVLEAKFEGNWVAVPVVEDPIPERPGVGQWRGRVG